MIVTYNPLFKSFKFFRYGIAKEPIYSISSNNHDKFMCKGICKYDFKHIRDGMWFSSKSFDIAENDMVDSIVNFFTDNYENCPLSENYCNKEYVIYDGDLNVCFTGGGMLVLYKNDLTYSPKRITKTFKRITDKNKQLCSKWGIPSYDLTKRAGSFIYNKDKDQYELNVWDFKSDKDFIVLPNCQIYNLVPEVFNDKLDLLNHYKTPIQDLYSYLYELDPFNSSRDYDVSPAERKRINDEKAAKQKEREEYNRRIEEQKHMDGYCDICGEPNASYVENPFYREMYGSSCMQWLCDDCYYQAAMDV